MALTLSDYFIKIGETKLPNKFIAKESYQASFSPISAGTYQDALGDAHEDYFPHKQLTVRFNTCAMNGSLLETFMGYFTSNYISGTKDINVTAWVPELNAYKTQRVSVSGLAPVLNTLSNIHTVIFDGFSITLTGRGGSA